MRPLLNLYLYVVSDCLIEAYETEQGNKEIVRSCVVPHAAHVVDGKAPRSFKAVGAHFCVCELERY